MTGDKKSIPDLSSYAGRWVALVRERVVGVGLDSEQALAAARHARPKEIPYLRYVPEQIPPSLFQASDWPLVQAAANVLIERQVEGLIAGGAVRDVLLGRPVHDWDFVVERDALRLARETADRLRASFYILDAERETGRVVVRHADGSRTFLDFALRRGEDWTADLQARDFALNTMAFSLNPPGWLYDPLGGRADLQARRVRAASPTSFQSDPVRILRGVRLAAALEFELETQTAEWARRDAALLERISAERVRDELMKMLAMDDAASSLRRLDDLAVLERVIPEVALMKETEQSSPHHWNVFEHTLRLVEMLERIFALMGLGRETGRPLPTPPHVWGDVERTLGPYRGDLAAHLEAILSDERTVMDALKLAALLHDCGKPATLRIEDDGRTRFFGHDQIGADMAAARVRALRLANVEVERVRTIVANHMRPQQLADSGLSARGVYRYFRDTGAAGIDIILLALADHLATHGPDVQVERWEKRLDAASKLIGEYLERIRASLDAPVLMGGGALIKALGLHPGPRVGELLEAIREAQIAGEIHTPQEALALARRLTADGRG